MTDKEILAKNLKYYMERSNKTRPEISKALGLSYYTVTDWVTGKKMPRMDKIQMLADYFGVRKSDLIEEKMTEEKEKDNEVMADLIVRMRTDDAFLSVVKDLDKQDRSKLLLVQEMLKAFGK